MTMKEVALQQRPQQTKEVALQRLMLTKEVALQRQPAEAVEEVALQHPPRRTKEVALQRPTPAKKVAQSYRRRLRRRNSEIGSAGAPLTLIRFFFDVFCWRNAFLLT